MTAATAQEDQIIRKFRDTVPWHPQCPECGAKIFRKAIEKTLKERGILKDVETVGELTLITCPECNQVIDVAEGKR